MSKYYFLAIVYLFSVVSSSIANSIDADVQNIYRIPFLNVRWIDIAILIILISFFYNLFLIVRRLKNTGFIILLCFIYIIFESFQLYRTWGLIDAASQMSHFLCTVSLFIVIDLSTYVLLIDSIILFLKRLAIWSAIAIIISNLYLLYSFLSGHVTYTDSDIRVGLEVAGSKEFVSSWVLTPFVYAFGLYFIQKSGRFWEKLLFLIAIFSIYGALVITYFRGTLVMLLIITIYFIFSSSNAKQSLLKMGGLLLFIVLGYLFFGGVLTKKGYDPVKKVVEIVEFTTDTENPDWDKGRSFSQEYAIEAWQKNPLIGAGYNDLSNYGLPDNMATAHNGVITSLFHRGIIGTFILMLILILLFKYAIVLWFVLRRQTTFQSDMIKLLILVSVLWIITFLTQEILWEKYSLSIEYMYLGLILNCYKQYNIKS